MKRPKAVVPMAGLGTRLFPATQACRKELFPVVGPDGVARALLHHQLRDLVRDGFQDIGLIVPPGGERVVRDYFTAPEPRYRESLGHQPSLRAEIEEMGHILECLTFLEQSSQEGFGHAVFQARHFASGDPFLLVTGDLLYRGPCRRKLVEALARVGGRSVSAVCRISSSQLFGYGTVRGARLTEDARLIAIERLIEKPSIEVARRELRMDGLPDGIWLGWFGLHALSPGIFDVLAAMIRDDVRVGGEIQMTQAQETLRLREGYYALEMTRSERFDFGLPEMIPESMMRFATPGPVPRNETHLA